jgi:hypothetical protein
MIKYHPQRRVVTLRYYNREENIVLKKITPFLFGLKAMARTNPKIIPIGTDPNA